MIHLSRKTKGTRTLLLTTALLLAVATAACGKDEDAAPQSSPTASSPASESPSASANPVAGTSPAAAERVMVDAMGHEVTIQANPKRIIASYLEDYLVTLGVKPAAQWSIKDGKSVQNYLQGDLAGIPTIGFDLPPEAVLSFNPDLIIIGSESSVQKGLYEQYAKIAPTYVIGDEINNDWRKALLKIGEVLGKSAEAEKALADYNQKAADAKEKLQAAVGEKSAAALWLVQKQFYLVDETRSSGAVLYGDLGLKQPNLVTEIPQEAKANWNPISLEKLAELDADHIFLVNSDKAQGADTLNDPIWQGLAAVKAGQVYEMDTNKSWLYTGYIAGQQIMDDVLAAMVK